MAKKIAFGVGDVVKLISGGPEMTIIKYSEPSYHEDHGTYECIWFNRDGALHEGDFNEQVVELIRRSNLAVKKSKKGEKELEAVSED